MAATPRGFLDRYFQLRGFLPMPLYALLPLVRWPPFDGWNTLSWTVGPALVAMGEAMRLWARRYIGGSSDTRKIKARALVTGGPFRRVRNPIYIGNVAGALGLCVAAEALPLAPVFLALLLVHYTLVVMSEERLLAGNFGDEYARYRRAAGRWLPRWSGPRPESTAPRESLRGALWLDRRQVLGFALALAVLAALDWRDAGAFFVPWS